MPELIAGVRLSFYASIYTNNRFLFFFSPALQVIIPKSSRELVKLDIEDSSFLCIFRVVRAQVKNMLLREGRVTCHG